MNATEKRHRIAREEYAKLRWDIHWEDCLSAYEYELTQMGPRDAENAIDDYYNDLVQDSKHHGLSDWNADDGPQVFDTMSGGSFSR